MITKTKTALLIVNHDIIMLNSDILYSIIYYVLISHSQVIITIQYW